VKKAENLKQMSGLPLVAKLLAFLKIQSAHCSNFQAPFSATHYSPTMVLEVELAAAAGAMLHPPSVMNWCLTAQNLHVQSDQGSGALSVPLLRK
jgi:hypothetical protein